MKLSKEVKWNARIEMIIAASVYGGEGSGEVFPITLELEAK